MVIDEQRSLKKSVHLKSFKNVIEYRASFIFHEFDFYHDWEEDTCYVKLDSLFLFNTVFLGKHLNLREKSNLVRTLQLSGCGFHIPLQVYVADGRPRYILEHYTTI